MVDILGLSIPGVLPYSEWIHGYAANIKEQAVSGKIIDVKIKGYTTKSTEEGPRFLVSRRDCVKSEWIGIEERFPLHSNIIIECVEMQGKTGLEKFRESPISLYTVFTRTVYLDNWRTDHHQDLAGSYSVLCGSH